MSKQPDLTTTEGVLAWVTQQAERDLPLTGDMNTVVYIARAMRIAAFCDNVGSHIDDWCVDDFGCYVQDLCEILAEADADGE